MPGIFVTDFAGLARVRLIQNEKYEWAVPVVDIADAIGYDRQALHQIINREPVMFEGFVNVTLTNLGPKGGRPNLVSVTEDGVNLLLMSLSPSRIKDEVKRQRVIAFKRWAAQTITRVRKGKLPETISPVLTDLFDLPARLRADAVRKIAQDEKVDPSTIYARLNKARLLCGRPIRTRSDRGNIDNPDEAAKILTYRQEHPDLSGPQLRVALGCVYSVASINRILKRSTSTP